MNIVALVGNLTKAPEARDTPSGSTVCTLRVAVNERVKQGDTWADRANYVDVAVFGKRAESAAKYLVKGNRVGVKGRLRWNEWTTEDGHKRQSLSVIAEELEFLTPKKDAGSGGSGGSAAAPGPYDDVEF